MCLIMGRNETGQCENVFEQNMINCCTDRAKMNARADSTLSAFLNIHTACTLAFISFLRQIFNEKSWTAFCGL